MNKKRTAPRQSKIQIQCENGKKYFFVCDSYFVLEVNEKCACAVVVVQVLLFECKMCVNYRRISKCKKYGQDKQETDMMRWDDDTFL